MPPSSSTTPSLPADDLASPRLQNLQQTHEGEHHGDYGGGVEIPITRSTYIYAFCAALNSCNLGYDVGVSTNVGGLIQDDFGLSDRQREVFVGAINFWSMFGAIFSNVVSDKFGRRRSFVVAAVLFILGVLIQSTANSLTLLHIGRFFVGVGVGFGLAIDPLYISEASPAKHRGELVTWSEIALNIGIVLGFTSGLVFYSLQDSVEWRVMIGMGGILPLVMIGLVYTVMPESPRWLVSKQREQEAKQVLSTIYPPNYNVDYVVDDIKEALEREEQAEHAVGWSVIFWSATPAIRRMLLVGVGTAIAQQAVGIDAIQYYLIDVLDESGVKSEQAQLVVLIILGLIKLGFVFVGGKLFDKRGRRPLLFASLIGKEETEKRERGAF
jgi:MFS family permease